MNVGTNSVEVFTRNHENISIEEFARNHVLLLSMIPYNKAFASEEVSINKSSIKLYVSGLYKLKVSGADDIEWSSDDESIATVTQKRVC